MVSARKFQQVPNTSNSSLKVELFSLVVPVTPLPLTYYKSVTVFHMYHIRHFVLFIEVNIIFVLKYYMQGRF